jgi:hypothetical protein
MAICDDPRYAVAKLAWMRAQGIWPNGLRYLWTDAFGVVLGVPVGRIKEGYFCREPDTQDVKFAFTNYGV